MTSHWSAAASTKTVPSPTRHQARISVSFGVSRLDPDGIWRWIVADRVPMIFREIWSTQAGWTLSLQLTLPEFDIVSVMLLI